MKYIILTNFADNEKVYIFPQHITHIVFKNQISEVNMISGKHIQVSESPEVIQKQIYNTYCPYEGGSGAK